MAEQVCIDYRDEFDLPVLIMRPSIVSVSENEPVCGWCDNLNGPMGLVLTAAIGLNHVTLCNGQNEMNVIPVDICAKGMIIAAWKVWKDRQVEVAKT